MNNEKIENILTLGLAGDIMLGRSVNEKITNEGYEYPWGDLLNLLKCMDITLLNLETTLTNSNEVVRKKFNFKAEPDKVHCLKKAGIDVLNLANNHILDYSISGMKETIDVLDNNDILHIGAGDNIGEASKAVVIEKKGIRIGFLGYTDNEPDWKATTNPGTNYVEIGDIKTIQRDVDILRNRVDIVVVSIHWGPNMRQKPSSGFKNFAHQIIDLGVDLIHGHSAHIFQGIELYKGGVIL